VYLHEDTGRFMRTKETIEASQTETQKPDHESGKKPLSGRERALANLIAPWTSETAPRNGGRPKKDMAQEIAKKVFEDNPELIYKACVEQLGRGGAFAFQVYSDRAYGKLKETKEVHTFEGDTADNELQERVAQLERECYPALYPSLTREAGEAAGTGSTPSGTQKANGAAKDPDLLP
jgi:hypothetical protein